MTAAPFELTVTRQSPEAGTESILCIEILRAVAGNREVFDARWRDEPVIAKVFGDGICGKRRLKREWQGLTHLRSCGISAPEPLFFGRTGNGRWAVVMRKIERAASLFDVFRNATGDREHGELLASVAGLLARQHESGIIQRDLHPGNFLLKDRELIVIDAGQMRFSARPVPRRASLSQLALLTSSIHGSQQQYALEMWREYFERRRWRLTGSDEQLLHSLTATHRRNSLKRGMAKCLRTGTRYLRISTRSYTAMFDREFFKAIEPLELIAHIDQFMDSGRSLKRGDTSSVSRQTLGGRDIVIKRYSHRGLLNSLRHTITGSRARQCWLYGHRLCAIGIQTARPLAYIEILKGPLLWSSYLVTEYVDGRNLHHLLREVTAVDDNIRRVISAVKRSVDILASHGIRHGDMKHSNFIVTPDGPVIIDLDAMKEGRPGRDIRRFMQGVNTTDVPEGIQAMCREVFAFDGPLPYRTSSDYMTARSGNWRLFVRRGYLLADAMHIVEGDAVCRDTHRFNRIFSSDFTRVYTSTAQHKGSPVSVHVKHYLSRSVIDPLKHLFRWGRGQRAFEASLMLRRNGFDSPEPLAFIQCHEGPFRTDNVLVTKTIGHALGLNTQLTMLAADSSPSGREQRGNIIRQFGAVVGRMHRAGIFHGDLRLGNVLVKKIDEAWHFHFIDNERTRKYDRLPLRLRIRNLVQINMFRSGITNTDRTRFWTAYVKETQATQEESRRWIRSVLRQTRRRLTTRVLHHPHVNAGGS